MFRALRLHKKILKQNVGFILALYITFLVGDAYADVVVSHIPRGSETNSSGAFTKWIMQHAIDNAVANNEWIVRTEYIRTHSDVVIESEEDIQFRSPRILLEPGFHAESGSVFKAGLPRIGINCVNLVEPTNTGSSIFTSTNDPPSEEEFQAICQNEVDLLTAEFTNEYGMPMVKFVLDTVYNWDASYTGTPFWQCISGKAPYSNTCWKEGDANNALFPPNTPTYGSTNSINIFFFNNPLNTSSRGLHAPKPGRIPYILLQYTRADQNCGYSSATGHCEAPDTNNDGILNDDGGRGGAEEHEMGHVFMLGHICSETAYTSNPMYHGDQCSGTSAGGDRVQGFLFEPYDGIGEYQHYWGKIYFESPYPYSEFGQAEIIMNMAQYYVDTLGEI